MEAYATVEDLKFYYPALGETQLASAEPRLMQASLLVKSKLASRGFAESDVDSDALKATTCAIANDALASSGYPDMYGVTQYSQTAGTYSESRTFANASGRVFWSKTYWDLLGVSKGVRVGGIGAAIHDAEGEHVAY